MRITPWSIALLIALAMIALAGCNAPSISETPVEVTVSRDSLALRDEGAKLEPARPAPASALATLCKKLCEKTARLKCPGQEGCAALCDETVIAAGECGPAMESYLTCLDAEPLANFECQSEGPPNVKPPACENEELAVGECLGR